MNPLKIVDRLCNCLSLVLILTSWVSEATDSHAKAVKKNGANMNCHAHYIIA